MAEATEQLAESLTVALEGADSGGDTATSDPQHPDWERIAQRAYERFLMRGGDHGRDQDDWFEAERDLNESSQR